MAIVYTHSKPDGEIFYVGISKNIYRPSSIKNRNKYWHNVVNKHGYVINILFNNVSYEEAKEIEMYLISYYGRKDLKTGNLVNMTIGGEGVVGNIVSEETKLKMSINNRRPFLNKKHTEESKLKISNSLKGKVQSQESRDKRSKSLKITWANEDLRELKRIQSKELNRLGLIGNKGMPSKKKGLPFDGDKIKLSESLKKHWANHDIWNKKKIDQCDIDNIIKLYSNGISILSLSKQYKFSRNVIYRVLNENNITVKPKKQNGNITAGS